MGLAPSSPAQLGRHPVDSWHRVSGGALHDRALPKHREQWAVGHCSPSPLRPPLQGRAQGPAEGSQPGRNPGDARFPLLWQDVGAPELNVRPVSLSGDGLNRHCVLPDGGREVIYRRRRGEGGWAAGPRRWRWSGSTTPGWAEPSRKPLERRRQRRQRRHDCLRFCRRENNK